MLANDFQPYWVYSPSKIISQFMLSQNIDIDALKEENYLLAEKLINLLDEITKIDSSTSNFLVDLLGGSVDFWNNLQLQHDSHIRKLDQKDLDAGLQNQKSLIKELKENSWIPKTDYPYLDEIYIKSFFGLSEYVPFVENEVIKKVLGSKFKKIGTYTSSDLMVSALITKAETEASKQSTNIWNKTLFTENLKEIKKLSRIKSFEDFFPQLQNICNKSGVAVVILETLSQSPIRGLSKFINLHKGLIVITKKYNKDYIFWQTFFHEAAHLVLHDESMIFCDTHDIKEVLNDASEQEADTFMINTLVYPYNKEDLHIKLNFNIVYKHKLSGWRIICRLANEMNISPSTFLGILKLEKIIPYNFYTDRHYNLFN